jgi:hypothetical protein
MQTACLCFLAWPRTFTRSQTTVCVSANVKHCVTGLEEAVERVAAEKDWSWLRIVPILRKCKAAPYVKNVGEVSHRSITAVKTLS